MAKSQKRSAGQAGGTQWVVYDTIKQKIVLIDTLLKEGYLRRVTEPRG